MAKRKQLEAKYGYSVNLAQEIKQQRVIENSYALQEKAARARQKKKTTDQKDENLFKDKVAKELEEEKVYLRTFDKGMLI